MAPVIIEVGNTQSKLVTKDTKLIDALWRKWSIKYPYIPGHRASFKRFFTKKGLFLTGLLDLIIADLNKVKVPYEIVNNIDYSKSPKQPKKIIDKIGKYTLYPFQKELVEKAIQSRRGILKSPTGSGKTLIMASLIKSMGEPKTLILFTQKQLVNQTFEYFKKVGIDVGINTGEGYINGNVMLSTVQSIGRIIEDFINCEMLLVDEVHEFSQSSDREIIISSFSNTIYRYGLTATPPSDQLGLFRLIGSFGNIISTASTKDLIEDKKLTKPIIKFIDMPETMDPRHLNGTYREIYNNYIVYNKERNEKIVNIIKNLKPGSKAVILVSLLDHILQFALPEFISLQGSDEISIRKDKIKKFVSSEGTQVIVGTKILQTGINIEEITCLINARGLSKDIPTIQALGRALRKHDSKDTVEVWDFLDKARILDRHSRSRMRHYKKEGHEVEII